MAAVSVAMLTVAAAAVPAGVAAPVGAWEAATEGPAATAAEETLDDGVCWSRRARCPSLTIWMMASASASSWRTAAWMLLAEPKLVEPGLK